MDFVNDNIDKRLEAMRRIESGPTISLQVKLNEQKHVKSSTTNLRLTFRCTLDEFGPKVQTVAMDCDNTVFAGGAPLFPKGAPITIYSQRYSGQQSIPVQVGNL